MDLGMNDTLNWGYMHCMIAASREMSDEPQVVPDEVLSKEFLSQFKTEADVSKFLQV